MKMQLIAQPRTIAAAIERTDRHINQMPRADRVRLGRLLSQGTMAGGIKTYLETEKNDTLTTLQSVLRLWMAK
jgi:hypothetical protein